jgi:hypothetical protein
VPGRRRLGARARALVTAAAGEHAKNAEARAETGPWRGRALNAESELKRAYGEITAQRARIGELLGRIRDLKHDPRLASRGPSPRTMPGKPRAAPQPAVHDEPVTAHQRDPLSGIIGHRRHGRGDGHTGVDRTCR